MADRDSASTERKSLCMVTDVFCLTFKDANMRTAFDLYCLMETSPIVVTLVVILSTILQIYFTAAEVDSTPLITTMSIIRLFSTVPGWFYLLQILSLHHSIPSILRHYLPSSRILADITCCSIVFALSAVLVCRCLVGHCDEHVSSNCNPELDVQHVPQDSLTTLYVGVIGVHALLRPRWCALVLAWCAAVVSIVSSTIITHMTITPLLPFSCIVVLLIVYQHEDNTLRKYIALQNMEQSIRTRMHAENEKRVMEMRSVEMRHLLGNVAHDLKTPMQSFVMDLELVEKMIKRPASKTAEFVSFASRDIQQIIDSLQHLMDTNSFMYMVINRAIDYAKNSSGHALVPKLDTINIMDTLQWAVNMVKSNARVSVKLDYVSTSICSHIITDKQWLIENILCLISNAVKFTIEGEVLLRMTLSPACDKCDMLLIEVEDTGIGIPKEMRDAVFQPFKQAMRMAGGTGLGLYSLHNRVDALGGECGLRDRSDGRQGCCFWFKIPYRPDDINIVTDASDIGVVLSPLITATPHTEASSILAETNTSHEQRTVGRKEIILVVDDSLIIRKTISRVLMNEGLSVDLAENGQMALEMIGMKRYDLVLMDLQMPVMDGLEAVRRLRKQEVESSDTYHQKVIGISAYTGEPYCSDALSAGMDAFIEKPFSIKHFLSIWRQC